jgi:SET domain-containing protein
MEERKEYRQTEWIDPRIEVRPSSIQGEGMFATAPITQGQVVNIWGGTVLLTEEDIESANVRERYTWSTIGEGLYLAVPQETEDLWDKMNHSCDPNVWMQDEVTLVARRDIAVGEELTIDYAMFEGTEWWVGRWKCRCGSELCRGMYTGRDWRRKDLQERYGTHFSPFINKRIGKEADRT